VARASAGTEAATARRLAVEAMTWRLPHDQKRDTGAQSIHGGVRKRRRYMRIGVDEEEANIAEQIYSI
jgi:hypothetical protein